MAECSFQIRVPVEETMTMSPSSKLGYWDPAAAGHGVEEDILSGYFVSLVATLLLFAAIE